jgi:hypothetical protein
MWHSIQLDQLRTSGLSGDIAAEPMDTNQLAGNNGAPGCVIPETVNRGDADVLGVETRDSLRVMLRPARSSQENFQIIKGGVRCDTGR